MKPQEKPLYEYIGRQIRERRQAIKLPQADLAQRMNMGRSSLANIEAGRQRVELFVLYALCVELDIDIVTVLPPRAEIIPRVSVPVTHDDAPPKTKAVVDGLLKGKRK